MALNKSQAFGTSELPGLNISLDQDTHGLTRTQDEK